MKTDNNYLGIIALKISYAVLVVHGAFFLFSAKSIEINIIGFVMIVVGFIINVVSERK